MMAFTLLRGSKDGDFTAWLQRAVDDLAIAFLALGAMLGRGGAAAAVLFDRSARPPPVDATPRLLASVTRGFQ